MIIFLDLLITHFLRVSALNHEEKCPDSMLCRWKQTKKKISMYRARASLKYKRQQKLLRRENIVTYKLDKLILFFLELDLSYIYLKSYCFFHSHCYFLTLSYLKKHLFVCINEHNFWCRYKFGIFKVYTLSKLLIRVGFVLILSHKWAPNSLILPHPILIHPAL